MSASTNMNLADPTARMLRRLILSNAYPIEVDKVGRILVPQNLRGFLEIESGELTVAGQGEYFEVWTPVNGKPKWKTCRMWKPTNSASPHLTFPKIIRRHNDGHWSPL